MLRTSFTCLDLILIHKILWWSKFFRPYDPKTNQQLIIVRWILVDVPAEVQSRKGTESGLGPKPEAGKLVTHLPTMTKTIINCISPHMCTLAGASELGLNKQMCYGAHNAGWPRNTKTAHNHQPSKPALSSSPPSKSTPLSKSRPASKSLPPPKNHQHTIINTLIKM